MDAPRQNLSDPIFAVAETQPDAPALIENNVRLSYGALARSIAAATVYLRDLGIREGDRVGVALTNSIEHVILLFALARMGAVPVELDHDSRTLAGLVAKYRMRAIFTEPNVELTTAVAHYPMRLTWRDEIAGKHGDQRSAANADALEIILLTSGSTGEPTGWRLSHPDVMGRAVHYNPWRYPTAADLANPANLLVVMSLRHIWMLSSVLAQFMVGGPVVLLPEYAKGADMLHAVASWGDAIFAVPPSSCRFLLRAAPQTGFLLPKLRRLETAGQLLHADEKRAIVTRVTPNFCECYGTTGGGFLTRLDSIDLLQRADTVGRPVPGLEIAIVGPGGEVLAPGTTGAIRCRPLFARGQCDEDGGRGSEHIEDGWCYPGDLGFLDADGFLHLRGRGGDILRRGGVEIFAPEIEGVLMAHPQVTEAAVVGKPVGGIGEEIVAFVVKRGALDHDELARHCRARLPAEKMPSRVFYADGLPRLAGGKLDRMRLQALAVEKTTAG